MSFYKIIDRLKSLKLSFLDLEIWLFDASFLTSEEQYQIMNSLNTEERSRADSYVSLESKYEFMLGRFFLRYLIADKMNVSLEDLSFRYNYNGKPILDCFPNLFFNLSHSKQLGIIGFSDHEIGVDIEFIDSSINVQDIMDMVLVPREKQWVLSEDTNNRFFQLWTMKEALLKCKGIGVAVDSFPELEYTDKDSWTYQGFDILSGFISDDFKDDKSFLGSEHFKSQGDKSYDIQYSYIYSVCIKKYSK